MPPISVMIKPASSACNLHCEYCFYNDVASSRKVKVMPKMNGETVNNIIKKSLAYADGQGVYFVFQGGEPMLVGLEFYEQFVKKLKKLNVKNEKVELSIQTNATLITKQFAEFFAKHNFLVGVSLDGDFDANRFRVDAKGVNKFHKVLSSIEILKKHNVEFDIVSVLTGKNAERIDEIYSYLTREKGFKYLQFIPILRPLGSTQEHEMYLTNKQYAHFLKTLFKLYTSDYKAGNYISIRQFDNFVRLHLGTHAMQCGMNGFCSQQFVVEGNGNVYPCDFFCLDEWLLGNINESDFDTISKTEKAQQFLTESVVIEPRCKNCEHLNLCRSCGCKRFKADYDYCQAYKEFFDECMGLFKVFEV